MSIVTQIAKFAGKVAKSPIGKLGVAAVAGGAVASIFSGCKKEVFSEPCWCIPMDNYDYILTSFQYQLKDDEYGQMAFQEWYQENFEGEFVEGCCGGLKPYNLEEWMQKCQQWIDNYLAGNDNCDELLEILDETDELPTHY